MRALCRGDYLTLFYRTIVLILEVVMKSWIEFVAGLSGEGFRAHWLARMQLAKSVGGEK